MLREKNYFIVLGVHKPNTAKLIVLYCVLYCDMFQFLSKVGALTKAKTCHSSHHSSREVDTDILLVLHSKQRNSYKDFMAVDQQECS
jgi:hypothetical protein